MKHSKCLLVIYLVSLIKLLVTILFFLGLPLNCYCLMISSLPVCLAGAYHSNLAWLCTLISITTILTWLVLVLLSFVGIKYTKARIVSVFLLAITNMIDFLTAFIYDDFLFCASCFTVSLIMFILCVMMIYNFYKKTEKPDAF